jgi:hypothetical protein
MTKSKAFSSPFESQTAGDFILDKKAQVSFCERKACFPLNDGSEGNMLLRKKARYIHTLGKFRFFNKNDLFGR